MIFLGCKQPQNPIIFVLVCLWGLYCSFLAAIRQAGIRQSSDSHWQSSDSSQIGFNSCHFLVQKSIQHVLTKIFQTQMLESKIEIYWRPRICRKYFLSFPQKFLSPEKTEIAKCLLLNFLVMKLTKTPILHNCQVPSGLFWQNCYFTIQKLKSKHLVCLSFLWWKKFFWGNEKNYFAHTPGPRHLFMEKILDFAKLFLHKLCEHRMFFEKVPAVR